MPAPGLFGKVPSHGDFVARRFPSPFREVWDAWLQDGIADSCAHFGAAWDEVWLSSPLWHFALGAGVADDGPVLGVLMPSVDRVGRQFPLTLACLLPPTTDLHATAAGAEAWFDHLDGLARSALAPDFDLETLDRQLIEGLPALSVCGPACPSPSPALPAPPPPLPVAAGGLWYPLDAGMTLAQGLAADLPLPDPGHATPCSYWWTEGLPGLPSLLARWPGLPPAAAFRTLLVGMDA